MNCNTSAEEAKASISRTVALYRELRGMRRWSRTIDLGLGYKLLRSIGENLRRSLSLPPVIMYWRRIVSREDITALVRDINSRARRAQLDAPGIEVIHILRARDFMESFRVAMRWACRPRNIDLMTIAEWESFSDLVWRIDDGIAARAAELHRQAPALRLVDEHDPANWLARLGVPMAHRRGPARSACIDTHDGRPSSRAILFYLRGARRAEHQRRWEKITRTVEEHAAANPGFARMLHMLIVMRGRRVSARADEWAAIRYSATLRARRERRLFAPLRLLTSDHQMGPSSSNTEVELTSVRLPEHIASASCACAACGSWFIGTTSGAVLYVDLEAGDGAAPLTAFSVMGSIAALGHVHWACKRLGGRAVDEELILVGTDTGTLACHANTPTGLEEIWAINVSAWWRESQRRGQVRCRLRYGEAQPGADSASSRHAISALGVWQEPGAASRPPIILVGTHGGEVYSLQLHRRAMTLRRLDVRLQGDVRTFVCVGAGLIACTTRGEVVSLHLDAIRGGKSSPEIIARFPGAAHMVAVERGFAPILLLAAARRAWIYDLVRDEQTELTWQGAPIESLAITESASGRHIAVGSVDGIALLNINRLKAWRAHPSNSRLAPGRLHRICDDMLDLLQLSRIDSVRSATRAGGPRLLAVVSNAGGAYLEPMETCASTDSAPRSGSHYRSNSNNEFLEGLNADGHLSGRHRF